MPVGFKPDTWSTVRDEWKKISMIKVSNIMQVQFHQAFARGDSEGKE